MVEQVRAYLIASRPGAHPYGDGFVQINQTELLRLAKEKSGS